MENHPTSLSPSSSGRRRRSSASNSPEFEFWMLRNPSCPQTLLHSADELFSGGVLLPLHQLNTPNSDDPPHKTTTLTTTTTDPETTSIAPKRWKDMFKKNPEKEKKKRNGGAGGGGGGGGTGVAELNINIWPFSRSKSAGNGGGRPAAAAAASGRKVSSAPCSRSNSAGESKSGKKWSGSPSRGGGVHVGRSIPVWQMKRVGSGRTLHDNLVRSAAEKGSLKKEKPETRRSKKGTTGAGGDATVAGSGAGARVKVLNLNVQTCIGYRHHLGCRSDEIREGKSIRVVTGGNAGVETGVLAGGEGPRGSNMFNLRNLFAKKVY